jgi:hypothetical protein
MRKIILFFCLFLPLLGLANVDPPEIETSEQIVLTVDVETATINFTELETPKRTEGEVLNEHCKNVSNISYIYKNKSKVYKENYIGYKENSYFDNRLIYKVGANDAEFDYSENRLSTGALTENKYNLTLYPNLSKSKSKKLLTDKTNK